MCCWRHTSRLRALTYKKGQLLARLPPFRAFWSYAVRMTESLDQRVLENKINERSAKRDVAARKEKQKAPIVLGCKA